MRSVNRNDNVAVLTLAVAVYHYSIDGASKNLGMMELFGTLNIFGIVALFATCHGQTDPGSNLYTIEQLGPGTCMTFDLAEAVLDDDRLLLSRCSEGPANAGQIFTVETNLEEEQAKFSIMTSDQKCFFVDSHDELRRSQSLCDRNLNYFYGQSASDGARTDSAGIRIKHWPSDKCLTANLDSTINLAPCESEQTRQKWRICRFDDPGSCLRFAA